MKISTTIFLTLLLSGLSAYYFISGQPVLREMAPELSPIKILTLSEGDSVLGFQIQNRTSKETVSLRREASEWRMEFPVSYPAENFLAEGIVSALTFSRRLRRFPLQGEAPKDLGFDSPVLKIAIETEKEPHHRFLLLGENSPVKIGVYARWEDELEYFLAPLELKASLERSVYSLRRKKLLRLDWNQVTWLESKIEGKEFRLAKQGEQWQWIFPSGRKEIPVEKISDLLYSFQSLYVKEFLDGKNPEKKEFGFKAKPSFIAVGGSQGLLEKLILGEPMEAKGAVYALREKENLVLLVSRENLKSLVQMLEVAYQEAEGEKRSENSGKAARDSGQDSKGRPESRSKSR